MYYAFSKISFPCHEFTSYTVEITEFQECSPFFRSTKTRSNYFEVELDKAKSIVYDKHIANKILPVEQ